MKEREVVQSLKQLFLDPVVGAICKSPFFGQPFQ
jgi:hypothetical protein